ncbi:MAG: hypothetical protein LBJ32_01485 [Oscillospiraceae bacterium]|jgi:small GTP-binding protein|nr:hypothetical protein [Oscillospiraceae bacterium]
MREIKRLVVILFGFFMAIGGQFTLAHTRYVKVVIVGDYSEGKTGLYYRIRDDIFTGDDGGQEFLYFQNGFKDLSIKIWDTPGLKNYFNDIAGLLSNSNFVLICIDVVAPFNKARREYFNKIYENSKAKLADNGKIVLVGTKGDFSTKFMMDYSENFNMVKNISFVNNSDFFVTSSYKGTFELYDCNGMLIKSGGRELISEYIYEKSQFMPLLEYDKNLHDNKFEGLFKRKNLEEMLEAKSAEARQARYERDEAIKKEKEGLRICEVT